MIYCRDHLCSFPYYHRLNLSVNDDYTINIAELTGQLIFLGEMLYNLCDHTHAVNGMSFSVIGEPILISCSSDKTMKVI